MMYCFDELASRLEEISTQNSRNQISQLIAEIFVGLSAELSKKVAYLLLGTLGPSYSELKFGLAEKQVQNFLLVFIEDQIGKEYVEKFLEQSQQSGDLGQAFFLILNDNSIDRPELTNKISLDFLFEKLMEIANVEGNGSVNEKRLLCFELLSNLSLVGQKYLIKILVGQLRLGFSTSSLLDGFSYLYAKDKSLKVLFEKNYNVCADIGLIIYNLKSFGIESLQNPIPKIGIPICPATAERVGSLDELLQRQQDLIVQPKLDGLRIQIHKSNGEVTLFSRNLLNVSLMFPEIVEQFLNLNQTDFIVDGELLGYDKQSGEDVNFQKTSQRRRKHSVDEASFENPTKMYLFDVLVWNNESFLNQPYFERYQILQKYFLSVGVIVQQHFKVNQDLTAQYAKDQILQYFLFCREKGYEGILAKKNSGFYEAGKRGFNWIKIKELDECKLNDSFDAIIIGLYFGKGRRASLGVGAFLIALFNHETQTFQSLAKVGSGLSDIECVDLAEKLGCLKLESKPYNYQVDVSLKPDLWIEPKFIVELQADDITLSKVHSVAFGLIKSGHGLALRFPRIIKIRNDKSPLDATSIEEIVRITKLRYHW